ncbi:hypothetical protein L7F22_042420 [Adiantum nelumboides]|nr:hypothetical protein [Adiantum nelumboides]
MRDSLVSPRSLRVGKLSKVKDDFIFEKVQFLIKAEHSSMRKEMKKDMYEILESYKADITRKLLGETRAKLYANIKNDLQWYVGAEMKVSEGVMHKKVDDALVSFETWKSKVEESIREKDALIEDLKKQLAIFKENLDTNEAFLKSSAQPQLQKEVKELKTNVENGLRAWSDVVKHHEENMKWIDVAKKQKLNTTPSASIINDTLEEEKRRKVRTVNRSFLLAMESLGRTLCFVDRCASVVVSVRALLDSSSQLDVPKGGLEANKHAFKARMQMLELKSNAKDKLGRFEHWVFSMARVVSKYLNTK